MTDLPVITISEDTNCSALIAELILDYYEIPNKEHYLKLMTGMGQGLDEGTLCGAVSGGMYAINLVLSEQGASEDDIIDIQNHFKTIFKEKYNSVNCGDILESRFHSPETFEEDVRQSRFCGSLLDDSAKEIMELANLAISALNPIMQRFNNL